MIQEILRNKYQDCLEGLDIYENRTSLVVPRIIVKDECRGSGVGTKIMNDLIAYADENKQIVALTPSSDFGGNKNRLIQFYKRFGFKHNKGVHKSFQFREAMIRYPKLSEMVNEIGDANIKPYPYKLDKTVEIGHEGEPGHSFVLTYKFQTNNGTIYDVRFGLGDNEYLGVDFKANDTWDVVNTGEIFKVMSTIITIAKEVLSKNPQVTKLVFSPTKKDSNDNSRHNLYMAFIKKQLPGKKVEVDSEGGVTVHLQNELDMVNEDKIKGGKADKMSIKDIADKFDVSVDNIEKEIEMGVKVELEHTDSKKIAKEIAMDHLTEIPDYYTRLKKMEKEGEKDWKDSIKESVRLKVGNALRKLI